MKEYKKYMDIYNRIENKLPKNIMDSNFFKEHIKQTKLNINFKNIYYSIGQKYFAYVLINYVLWIVENIKKDNVEEVCFLARDGYIVKECYDLYRKYIDNKIPKSKYIYASRSIFYNAAITEKFDWTDNLLLNLPYGQNIKSYFSRWNIEEDKYIPLLKKYNINSNHIISNEEDRKMVKELYFELRDYIIKRAEENRDILMYYWKNEGLLGKNIAFIDIGWNATCECCIEKIISIKNINITPHFYFFGTLSTNKCEKMNKNLYKGCFFDLGKPNEISELIFEGIPIIESFFSAPHPYIIKLQKRGNKIYPIYDETEIKENLIYMNYMHKGAISKIINILEKKDIEKAKLLSILPLAKLIIYPSKKEAKALSNFKVSVTFGSEVYNIPLIRKIKMVEFFNNRKQIKKEYDNTMWKSGYKKINGILKLNLVIRV